MLDGMFYHKDRWSSKKRPELRLGAFKRSADRLKLGLKPDTQALDYQNLREISS